MPGPVGAAAVAVLLGAAGALAGSGFEEVFTDGISSGWVQSVDPMYSGRVAEPNVGKGAPPAPSLRPPGGEGRPPCAVASSAAPPSRWGGGGALPRPPSGDLGPS